MKISRRNFLAVAGAAAAAAALTACGGSSASSASTASSAAASTASSAAEGGEKIVKVALTCDTGTIDDESFNQACWTAVSSYMGDDCQYYIPEADASDEDRETMIRQAVNDGADVIVCVGYLYGASLAWAADQYPDVNFTIILSVFIKSSIYAQICRSSGHFPCTPCVLPHNARISVTLLSCSVPLRFYPVTSRHGCPPHWRGQSRRAAVRPCCAR